MSAHTEVIRNGMTAEEELRLLKAQLQDIARVCDAVRDGDLSQSTRTRVVPVTSEMVSVDDAVNGMVRKLSNQAATTSNFVRAVGEVAHAAAVGDLKYRVTLPLEGEMLEVKAILNAMMDCLAQITTEMNRVSAEMGACGRLGLQVCAPGVEGAWKSLAANVNLMVLNTTCHVRAVTGVVEGIAEGDFTKSVNVEGSGEFLALTKGMNHATATLRTSFQDMADLASKMRKEAGDLAQVAVRPKCGFGRGPSSAARLDEVEITPEPSSLVRAGREDRDILDQLRRSLHIMTHVRETAELSSKRHEPFAMMMTTELNTNIQGIINFLELVLETDLLRAQRELCLLAHSSARSMLMVVSDIADINRIEAGQMHLVDRTFSLRQTVFDTVMSFISRAFGNNLDLIFDLDPALPDRLEGDVHRLRQILSILLANALKFTPSRTNCKDRVGLSCKCIALGEEATTVEFCIHDTGIGILADHLSIILDGKIYPYSFRSDGVHGGTGIGLAICQGLIAAMGGQLRVESEVGQGSKFYVTVSIRRASSTTAGFPSAILPYVGYPILCLQTAQTRKDGELVDRIQELGLQAVPFHDVSTADNSTRPCCSVLVADSLAAVEAITDDYLRALPTVLLLPDSEDQYQSNFVKAKLCLDNAVKSVLSFTCDRDDFAAALVPILDNCKLGESQGEAESLTILVAEDNYVNQSLIAKILDKYGHNCEIFETGADAVEGVKRTTREGRPFDAILMDIAMPVMGGVEATELIRQFEREEGCSRLPIIAMSAHPFKGDLETCLAAGFDGLISKPIRRIALLKTVMKQIMKARSAAVGRSEEPASPPEGASDHSQDLDDTADSAWPNHPAAMQATNVPAGKAEVEHKVLVVDDNMVNQLLLTKILEKYGHIVELADNGSVAVDAFKVAWSQNRCPDIILMDSELPLMGGIEATEQIRAYEREHNLPRTPIIGAAYDLDDARERWKEAGADDVLCRPIRRASVLKMLGEHIVPRELPELSATDEDFVVV